MSADPATIDKLKSWLEFYQEIGLESLSLNQVGTPSTSYVQQQEGRNVVKETETRTTKETGSLSLFEAELGRDTDDSLEKIREDIGDCQRCKLCSTRTNIVFGSGNSKARLVF